LRVATRITLASKKEPRFPFWKSFLLDLPKSQVGRSGRKINQRQVQLDMRCEFGPQIGRSFFPVEDGAPIRRMGVFHCEKASGSCLGIKVISLLTFFLTQKKVSPEREAHCYCLSGQDIKYFFGGSHCEKTRVLLRRLKSRIKESFLWLLSFR